MAPAPPPKIATNRVIGIAKVREHEYLMERLGQRADHPRLREAVRLFLCHTHKYADFDAKLEYAAQVFQDAVEATKAEGMTWVKKEKSASNPWPSTLRKRTVHFDVPPPPPVTRHGVKLDEEAAASSERPGRRLRASDIPSDSESDSDPEDTDGDSSSGGGLLKTAWKQYASKWKTLKKSGKKKGLVKPVDTEGISESITSPDDGAVQQIQQRNTTTNSVFEDTNEEKKKIDTLDKLSTRCVIETNLKARDVRLTAQESFCELVQWKDIIIGNSGMQLTDFTIVSKKRQKKPNVGKMTARPLKTITEIVFIAQDKSGKDIGYIHFMNSKYHRDGELRIVIKDVTLQPKMILAILDLIGGGTNHSVSCKAGSYSINFNFTLDGELDAVLTAMSAQGIYNFRRASVPEESKLVPFRPHPKTDTSFQWGDIALARQFIKEDTVARLGDHLFLDRSKWYYPTSLRQDPELYNLSEGLDRPALELRDSYWSVLEPYNKIDRAAYDERPRFLAAAWALMPDTKFSLYVDKILQACLYSCNATQDLRIMFVDGQDLPPSSILIDDEKIVRINDNWLYEEEATRELGLCRETPLRNLMLSTSSALFDKILDQLALDEESRTLHKNIAKQRLLESTLEDDHSEILNLDFEPGSEVKFANVSWETKIPPIPPESGSKHHVQLHHTVTCSGLREALLVENSQLATLALQNLKAD
ncbi:hypothetical protein FBEOM_3017 [Fusarium beomiforme]|uniref:Uncharacterized protein n=1 Tax=Fusarium beomiforme TaxID=44412 RepID=A0A9P5AQW2_9HYPO|nr:hypothetical protein FBEOM_3017 [Fusarium beomiforme]